MSRSAPKRLLGALRRVIRRRRAPSPSEQEWLRLILLVRRLQHGQLSFVQRLEDIRALTGAMGSFRSDFSALHEQLGAARESAGELERGLAERSARLDATDPERGREELDRRLGALDALAARLETLAAQAPVASAHPEAESALLARLSDVASRLEAAHLTERAVGGQDELARLYERIQELAEGMRAPRPRADGEEAAGGGGDSAYFLEQHVARLGEQLETLDSALQTLGTGDGLQELGATLGRLEKLAKRFEKKSAELRGELRGDRGGDRGGGAPAGDGGALIARLEDLVARLEQTPVALPDLPADALTDALDPAAVARELEGLRAALAFEQDSRRQSDEELSALRDRLRASELARVELETRHATELTQMADHVQRQLQRVEEDLKKKKRGLAELTQQNITLQSQLARLTRAAEPAAASGSAAAAAEPAAALPAGGEARLSELMRPEAPA